MFDITGNSPTIGELHPIHSQLHFVIKEQVYLGTRKNVCWRTTPLTNEQFEESVLTTIRGRTAALRADLAAQ